MTLLSSPRAPSRLAVAVVGVVGALVGVSGCGSTTLPPTADQVVRQLATQVHTASATTVYTAESDPNKLLGRPNGYVSKAEFADSRATEDSPITLAGVDGGGSVEVFADEDRATARRTYLDQIGQKLPTLASEYDYQSGPVLVRVSHRLTPAQAAEYQSALTSVINGTAPAPAAPAASVAPPTAPAAPATVSVATVHDAATVVLTDGTRLRQVGISAPTPSGCQAVQATATTDAEVRRGPLTYQLLGQSDTYGNQWAYLRIGTVDLGQKLAGLGWVWAYPDSPAPPDYQQRIAAQADAARAAGLGLFGPTCPGSAAPAPVQPVSAPTASTVGDGTWVVGSDIPSGTYRTTGPSEEGVVKMCIWSRRKDTSGEVRSVIATDIAQGPTTVTIKPTDGAFESRGCAPWTKLN
jgi:endonuclease YncB( thermonuclease family)